MSDKKKIMIIGSTEYQNNRIAEHRMRLETAGNEVLMPAFDDHVDLDALGVCEHNRDLMEKADEVHIIWNQRSLGTILDFGMALMARKVIKIIYLEPKTIAGVVRQYAQKCKENK